VSQFGQRLASAVICQARAILRYKILPRLIPLSAHYFKDGIYILVQEQNNNKQGNHITLPRIKQAAYAMVNPTSHAAAGGDIWNNAVTKHDWLTGKNGDMSANFFRLPQVLSGTFTCHYYSIVSRICQLYYEGIKIILIKSCTFLVETVCLSSEICKVNMEDHSFS
jgi:hypothetical protein